MHSQQPSSFTLNARADGTFLAAKAESHWVCTAVERLDWKAQISLRKKGRKSWDAVQQLLRYREVVGEDAPISTQASENEEFLGDTATEPKADRDR